ncbi:YobI family P-loop NTPase [Clostridium perfringens]|uniref:YobI family P-loop NTPase n=1 Tax=Clostridium perfringens TaxID=1502 RepID=UPI0018994487|nr:hypothetical protein [Clostridium perfringens]
MKKSSKVGTRIKKYVIGKYKLIIEKISLFINLCISLLAKINNKILKKLDYKKEYESLAPKDNLDKNNSYIKALKESIDDLKRKNIAISGIYGSGKSSIIESFKEQYKEYKYLDISLATFISSEDDNLEEELERNILNQIFYKVSYDKMPYSRFRKIKNIRFLHIFKVTLIFISLLLTLSLLIKPELIEKFTSNILKLKGLFSTIPIVKYNVNLSLIIVMIVCSITILYITMILIKFILSKFTINKIQTKDGNLQLGKREESETFNKYLDEIMYFFESLKYDIVFFEDLDRFDNLEIFTKLRELNTLINKAESISKKVTFVYAIKDEIFFIKEDLENDDEYKYIDKKEMNKNRTKFFDFIIPVIPIVNGENSYEILNKKIEEFNEKYGEQGNTISKELLSDLSIFIDDMRLLTNIYNEFLIYYKRLVKEKENSTLSVDNLLAIIVYKNLYPVDFTKLQNRDGMVYNVFFEKNKIADKVIGSLYEKLEVYKLNIQQLEKEILENEEELYAVYNQEWNSMGAIYIRCSNGGFGISDLKNIKAIEKLKNANSIEFSSNTQYYNSWRNISFKGLMTINGKKPNFYERLMAIKSKGINIEEKIKYNQNKIQAIEAKIKEFKSNSVATLMKDERFFDCLDEKIKKEALIIRLLKYGYIDEMYSYYSLYFYAGRLTQKDFEFVQSVIYNKPLNCEFKLDNINEILVKFRIEDFESKAILNYDLIKFLSENIHIDINKMRLKKIIGILSELKTEDINFIMDFIHKRGEIANFIELLCKNINKFWNNIYENSYLSSEKKDYMLELLFKYCSIEDILIQNDDGYIKEYIELNSNFIKTIAIKIEKSKLKDILIKLNVKLKDIDQDIVDNIKSKSNKEYMSVFEDVYYNDLYELNIDIVSKVIFIENKNIENMNEVDLSYSCISKNELNGLIKYIDNNINLYIRNIFIEPIVIENTETIIDILNSEEVDKDLIDNIVNIKQFKVDDINKIKNIDIWNLIFDNLKVNFSWENILSYYKANDSIDKHLGSFINNLEVCKELLKDTLYKESISNDEKESIDLFVEKFVMSKIISDETVELLASKLGSPFRSFDFEGMIYDRILILINKKLIALTESIYKSLKVDYHGLHINLLEENIDKFISEKIQDFDSKDIEVILKSDKISQDNKYYIIKLYGEDIEINDSLAEIIFDVIEKFLPNEKIKYKLIESIIRCNFEKEKRRKLIAYQIEFIDKMDISNLLSYIDDEYNGLLGLSSKRMYIKNTNANILILEKLKSKKYISSFKTERNRIIVNRKRT